MVKSIHVEINREYSMFSFKFPAIDTNLKTKKQTPNFLIRSTVTRTLGNETKTQLSMRHANPRRIISRLYRSIYKLA